MFGLFNKKTPDTSIPQKSPSLFSTDILEDTENRATKLLKQINAARDAIPIPLNKTIPVDADGNSVAMDSSFQEVKAFNTQSGILPEQQFFWFAGQTFIGYQACAIIAQNWLIDKACSMPGRDAARHGYEITVNDGTEVQPEVLDEIRKADKRMNILGECTQFVRFGRIFGIRVAMFLVDGINYAAPFNPDGVRPGSYRGITQIDPYWITPELDLQAAANPASQHFYDPTWWRVNGQRIHRSHLIIFRNGDLPDILKPTYFYGGIPVPQKLAERVYAAERTANEAPLLALTKRTTVFKMDLTQGIANFQQLAARVGAWSGLWNNTGVKVIGDQEEVNQFETSLTDLDAVIMTQFQLVAAAADVPATKLMGTSPKGFNATGEYEEASYHEYLESIQQHELTPLVARHHELLIRSYIAPKFGLKPFAVEANWNPVDSPTAAELADINQKKSQTDNALVQTGAIDGFDVRQRLINDKDSGFNGIPDVVPDGPGDREHEQELQEKALEKPDDNGSDK